MDQKNKHKTNKFFYKPVEEKIYPICCERCKKGLKEKWGLEKEKRFVSILYGFLGFILGSVWIIILSSFWGGRWTKVYDSDMDELGLDFFLDEKVFIVTGIIWLAFFLYFVYSFSRNKKK